MQVPESLIAVIVTALFILLAGSVHKPAKPSDRPAFAVPA